MGVLCLAALCPTQFGRGGWSLAGPGSVPPLGLAVQLCPTAMAVLLWHLWELHAAVMLLSCSLSAVEGPQE